VRAKVVGTAEVSGAFVGRRGCLVAASALGADSDGCELLGHGFVGAVGCHSSVPGLTVAAGTGARSVIQGRGECGVGDTAFGDGRCLVDRRADQGVTHAHEVAVDPKEAGALHLRKGALGDAQGAAGAPELRVVKRVVGGRQQHQGLGVLAQPTTSVEEGPFHAG
jgi:hypothetical protein